MAKYGRYDPRNKKKDRNKSRSINKDIRIREEDHKMRGKKIDWIAMDELEDELDEQ